MLSVEIHGSDQVMVKLSIKRISIFGETCSEHDYLVAVTHSLNKLLTERSLKDINVLSLSVYFHSLNYMRIVYGLERGVDECLIKI